jgi:hypothetical protein
MGSGRAWMNEQSNSGDVQYIAFFRDPISKYISGRLYIWDEWKRDLSFNETVSRLKEQISKKYEEGKYSTEFKKYIITPEQRSQFKTNGIVPTIDQLTNLTMSNLVNHEVVVGIVERMSESLELLQFVMDSDRQLTSLFQKYGMKDKDDKSEVVEKNKSGHSTSAILEELRRDQKFFQKFQEFVKYDQIIYDFALELHERQYHWLRQN